MGVVASVKTATSKLGHLAPRPRPPQTPELAGRLRLAVTRLARRLRREVDAGISASQLTTMATLSRSSGMTLGELAAVERVQPPTMTKIVAGLEAAGLTIRETDQSDRRVARVRLSQAGDRLIRRSRSRKNAYLARMLLDLPAGDRAALERAVPVLERLLGEAE